MKGNHFQAGSVSSELSESEDSSSEIEEPTNDEILKNDEYHDEAKHQTEMDAEDTSRGTCSKISGRRDDDVLSDSVVRPCAFFTWLPILTCTHDII